MELNTHETMKFLSDAERDRFVAFQELFESTGWRLLVEYAQAKAAAAIQRGAYADTWDNQRMAAGYREAWAEIVNIDSTFMREFEVLADERRSEIAESSQPDFEVLDSDQP